MRSTGGAAAHRSPGFRHLPGRSLTSSLSRMQRCLTTRSSRSSCDVVLPASLPERRSVWRSSPPCSTEPPAACPQISSIRLELSSISLYLIVHAVEGLESGAYVFHRDRDLLECLKQGNFRAQAGHLGLDQELAADAAVDIFFLADLRLFCSASGIVDTARCS